MNLLNIQNRILELMTLFVVEVKGASAMGRTDINHVSQTLLVPLFAEIYGYKELKDLNTAERMNFPGIDLGDESAGVAFQITATPSSDKVKETLRMFVKHEHYKRFRHLIVYIISEKKGSFTGSGYDEIIKNRFTFDKDKDIRDFRDTLRHITSLRVDQLLRVEAILEANLGRRGALVLNRLNEPVEETQHLHRLVKELESHQGVQEYVELSTTGEAPLNDPGRPTPSGQKVRAAGLQLIAELITGQAEGRPVAEDKETLHGIKEAVEKLPQFILLGDPGGGKTTTIQRLAFEAAHDRMVRPSTAPLPLLLDLSNWRDGQTLYDFIRSGWRFDADPFHLLARGEVSLYLDGLDAMGARWRKNAERLREWLHSEQAPRRVIVTCRGYEYTNDLNLGLPVVRAEELSEEQIKHLARNHLNDEAGEFLKLVLPETEDDRRNPRHVFRLARNPYLLVALMLVHKELPGEQLPRSGGVLLGALVRGAWDRELKRGTVGGLSFGEVTDAYSRLAFAMINENSPASVPVVTALRHLKNNEVLRAGCGASIVERGGAGVRFYHQLLQEYFAALRLSRVGFRRALRRKPSVTRVALKHVFLSFLRKGFWKRLVRGRGFDSVSSKAGVNAFRDFGLKWYEVLVALCDLEPRRADEVVRAALASGHLFLAGYAIAKSDNISTEAKDHAVSSLLNKLRRGGSEQRDDAAQALGLIGGEAAIDGLIEALKDVIGSVQVAAVGALTQIGGDEVAARLVTVLRDKSAPSMTRARAAQVLGHIQFIAAVPDLLSALREQDWNERWFAAFVLGQLKEQSSVRGLAEAVSADDWHGQWAAAWALGNIGDVAAVPVLLRSMRRGDILVQFFSAVALGNLRSADAVTGLIQTLNSDSSSVRGAAAWALGKIGDSRALPSLETLLDDAGVVEWVMEGRETRVHDEAEGAIRSILVRGN